MINKQILIVKLLVILGALNWGLYALNIDTGSYITKYAGPDAERLIYLAVGLSAIYLLTNRDFFLPFLGEGAYPCGSLLLRVPENANVKMTIKTESNVNIIYWAAESNSKTQPNPLIAYSVAANAGVARSDENGNAVLSVRLPASYLVRGTQLPLHIHYRICKNPGLVGEVKTVNIPQSALVNVQSPSVPSSK